MNKKLLVYCLTAIFFSAACIIKPERKFVGAPVVQYLNAQGQLYGLRIKTGFGFVDEAGKIWVVPDGVIIDSTSLPEQARTLAGSPYTADYRNAFIVHAYHCKHKQEKWLAIHRMFFEACLTTGVDEPTAKMMYAALYAYAPRWEANFIVDYEAGVHKRIITSFETTYPDTTFETDCQWIRNTNPSLDAIDARLKGSLTFTQIRKAPR
ncbi:DUF1353 domain-containing protein [Arsenicibacter rosenii]|uniref:Uncharacterized protein n=1 Tax=Arsenicibacter rosenii TaxID=1750698 RepID=A0A1S2VNB7_9BACT|nr:DUF1353 domain-containing protein [Arsenicibacter rosenii]OIN60244.1 hypothetical protein BLX24_05260 [Arsenicibacter rosenii]